VVIALLAYAVLRDPGGWLIRGRAVAASVPLAA